MSVTQAGKGGKCPPVSLLPLSGRGSCLFSLLGLRCEGCHSPTVTSAQACAGVGWGGMGYGTWP